MVTSSWLKWRPVTTALIIGGVVLVVVAAAIAFMVTTFALTTTLRVGDGVFQARLVTSEEATDQMVAQTAVLAADRAFIAAFSEDVEWTVPAGQVGAPLDIVWLDQNKKIIYIVKNLTPDDSAKTYRSDKPARYVLGLPGGTVDKKAIRIGLAAVFDSKQGEEK